VCLRTCSVPVGMPDVLRCRAKALVSVCGWIGPPCGSAKTRSRSTYASAAKSRSSSCVARCSRSTRTLPGSSAIVRRERDDLGRPKLTPPRVGTRSGRRPPRPPVLGPPVRPRGGLPPRPERGAAVDAGARGRAPRRQPDADPERDRRPARGHGAHRAEVLAGGRRRGPGKPSRRCLNRNPTGSKPEPSSTLNRKAEAVPYLGVPSFRFDRKPPGSEPEAATREDPDAGPAGRRLPP
jgi:hypothetical protein